MKRHSRYTVARCARIKRERVEPVVTHTHDVEDSSPHEERDRHPVLVVRIEDPHVGQTESPMSEKVPLIQAEPQSCEADQEEDPRSNQSPRKHPLRDRRGAIQAPRFLLVEAGRRSVSRWAVRPRSCGSDTGLKATVLERGRTLGPSGYAPDFGTTDRVGGSIAALGRNHSASRPARRSPLRCGRPVRRGLFGDSSPALGRPPY